MIQNMRDEEETNEIVPVTIGMMKTVKEAIFLICLISAVLVCFSLMVVLSMILYFQVRDRHADDCVFFCWCVVVVVSSRLLMRTEKLPLLL